MCKINCSGGCPDCAPDEHAASKAIVWLEEQGFEMNEEDYIFISNAIAKRIYNKETISCPSADCQRQQVTANET